MKALILTLLLACSLVSFAQSEEEALLEVGDTIYFGECVGVSYQYIDLYVKTRFELDSISYDSLDGWAFYNRFFNDGDFDVSRLPCSYRGQYGVIKHLMAVRDEDDNWVNVVVVMIEDGRSVGYIIENAFESEIIYVPKEDTRH